VILGDVVGVTFGVVVGVTFGEVVVGTLASVVVVVVDVLVVVVVDVLVVVVGPVVVVVGLVVVVVVVVVVVGGGPCTSFATAASDAVYIDAGKGTKPGGRSAVCDPPVMLSTSSSNVLMATALAAVWLAVGTTAYQISGRG
jgi:hypothetical protein